LSVECRSDGGEESLHLKPATPEGTPRKEAALVESLVLHRVDGQRLPLDRAELDRQRAEAEAR